MTKELRDIDLHMHSTVSDGTDTPAELLARVKEAGIVLFSVTDHDAVGGSMQIKSLLKEGDPAFIFGAEFSCEDEGGKYHILAYGYEPQAAAMQELTRTCHDYRMNKVTQRLDFLEKEFGFTFSDADRAALFARPNPGKPHIANLMVQLGYVPSMSVAFKEYLNRFKSVEKRIRPEVAIQAIALSGGIPVLAHPAYGSGDELIIGKDMEDRLVRLMQCGIRGVEAFYSGFSRTLQDGILSLAEKYGLYVTAGSDYHGTNKMVRLGDTNLKNSDTYPTGLQRFIQDVKKY